MPNCNDFYVARDQRSVAYTGTPFFDKRPVYVAVDDCVRTPAAQLALVALANQLARVHRRVIFSLPDVEIPVAVATPFPGTLLRDLLLSTVNSIDPCGSFELSHKRPGNAIALGIGVNADASLDWYLGAQGSIAFLSHNPVEVADNHSTLRGAALASCLGASTVFRMQLGRETVERKLSCWNYMEDEKAGTGPELMPTTDVGRVLMVGAGAVAASLTYWLRVFGVGGEWTIVDRDVVKLHNVNRGLIFTAKQAGWPESKPVSKVECIAELLPNTRRAISCWYDETPVVSEPYDVILALANERSVRHFIASKNATVVLQATTGENWLSQLHRHIAGMDDCVWCRTGEVIEAIFGCSSAPVDTPEGERSDASLPFLSAASGLMLATAIQKLQVGELAKELTNDWRWDFESTYRMASCSIRKCKDNCKEVLPRELRGKLNADTRWAGLDH